MMFLLRHLFFFVLQFGGVTAAVVAGCVAWTLNDRGISYAETLAFRADLKMWTVIGMVVAGFFCLILLCYHLTHKALDGPSDPDNEPWRY